MLARNPGTNTIVAKCTNLKTKIDAARIMMFRRLRNARLKVGFGCNSRLASAAANRNAPPASIPTMPPEFSQYRRSP